MSTDQNGSLVLTTRMCHGTLTNRLNFSPMIKEYTFYDLVDLPTFVHDPIFSHNLCWKLSTFQKMNIKNLFEEEKIC